MVRDRGWRVARAFRTIPIDGARPDSLNAGAEGGCHRSEIQKQQWWVSAGRFRVGGLPVLLRRAAVAGTAGLIAVAAKTSAAWESLS